MPRSPVFAAIALAFGLATLPTIAQADVLLIERAQADQDMDLPRRGESRSQVEQRFGEPSMRHAPVGGGHPQRPPITRWDYPTFSVYFEHDHVVDSVLKRSFAEEAGPKPVH